MTTQEAAEHLAQVLEEQADDMFTLYQLSQILAEATDLDELAYLALTYLVRVSDSAYAALFLQRESDPVIDLVASVGPDGDDLLDRPARFTDGAAAQAWFERASGLGPADCLLLPLDVGRPQPGLLALAAASHGGLDRHQQRLLATMSRELVRVLRVALVRSDLARRQLEIERMQSDFVTAVSHELRTPLALIQASLDSLRHLNLDAQQQRRFLDDLAESTAQLTRTVNTILSFSRVEEAPWPLNLRPIDLGELTREVAAGYPPAAQARLHLHLTPMHVRADRDRLVQIIGNLIDNALKYSGEAAPVYVRGHLSHGLAKLDICDRGLGIPPEDQPFLGHKFFRATNVRESSHAGTGLGLYLARRLLEAQGGSLRIRSRLGYGTIVRILLPTVEA